MRTNIVLDEALVKEATRLTGIGVRKDLVHRALQTLIEVYKRKSLLDLEGKIQFAKGYDHKKARKKS